MGVYLRSDGLAEAPSGHFGVKVTHEYATDEDGSRFFVYQTSFYGPLIHLSWDGDADNVVFLEQQSALDLVSLGHARHMNQNEVDKFNEQFAGFARQLEEEAAEEEPEAPQSAPVAAPAPVVPATPTKAPQAAPVVPQSAAPAPVSAPAPAPAAPAAPTVSLDEPPHPWE